MGSMPVAAKLTTVRKITPGSTDLDELNVKLSQMIGIYAQVPALKTDPMKYYYPKQCSELFPQGTVEDTFYEQL